MRDEGGERDAALAAALAGRLRASGLARVADDLLALAQPAIHLDLRRVDDEATLPLGGSKVGGAPDLPADVGWPATGDGQPLPFIAQMRLAEIAALDPEGDLPHDGLLSFFYAINDAQGSLRIADDASAWRVLWTRDDAAPLERRPTPAALVAAPDGHFPACAVSFARRLTLPDVYDAALERISFTNDERLGYIRVVGGEDVGYHQEMDCRLLGYPYELEPGTFVAAYMAAHGIEPPRVDLSRAGRLGPLDIARGLWRTIHPDPAALEAQRRRREMERLAADEWRLLVQIYSNDEAGMDWAGGGVIHFGVQRAALAARDFSRVWVSLQFL